MRSKRELWDAVLASSRMPWAGGPPVELGAGATSTAGWPRRSRWPRRSPRAPRTSSPCRRARTACRARAPRGWPIASRTPPARAQPGARGALPRARGGYEQTVHELPGSLHPGAGPPHVLGLRPPAGTPGRRARAAVGRPGAGRGGRGAPGRAGAGLTGAQPTAIARPALWPRAPNVSLTLPFGDSARTRRAGPPRAVAFNVRRRWPCAGTRARADGDRERLRRAEVVDQDAPADDRGDRQQQAGPAAIEGRRRRGRQREGIAVGLRIARTRLGLRDAVQDRRCVGAAT